MRMIVCNLWGGRVFGPLMKFIEQERGNTDVFLFQEMYNTSSEEKEFEGDRVNLLAEMKRALPDFEPFFEPDQEGYVSCYGKVDHFEVAIGVAGFVRKDIQVIRHGGEFVFRYLNARDESTPGTTGRTILFLELEKNDKRYTLVNFHGLWNGQGKGDSPDRLEQSRKIRAFMDKVEGPKILAGDFNLMPDTESLKMLEEGMENLIKTHGITTTRSEFYTKPIKFADYVLVSPEIQVKSFAVPNIPISDHLPMIVEFE